MEMDGSIGDWLIITPLVSSAAILRSQQKSCIVFTWHLSKQVQKYRLSNEIGNLFLAGVWRMALYAGVIRCSAWHKQVPCGEKEDAWSQLDEVIDSFMDHKEMQHTSSNQPPSAQRLLCPAVDPSIIELVTRAPAIAQFITLPSYSAASSGHALWPFFLDKQSKECKQGTNGNDEKITFSWVLNSIETNHLLSYRDTQMSWKVFISTPVVLGVFSLTVEIRTDCTGL